MSLSVSESLVEFFNELTSPESASELQKYMIAFGCVVVAAAIIYMSSADPTAQTSNFYIYSIFGVLPVIIGILIISPLFSGPLDRKKMYLFGSIFAVFLITMYLFYRIMNPTSIGVVTNLFSILGFLGMIVGLAIVYRVFVRSIIHSKGWFGFFMKVIFLIPCLLVDIMEYFVAELKNTSRMVFVLFILEILIILAYIYLPRLLKMSSTNTIVLLNKPIFISKKTIIGRSEQFTMDKTDVNNPSKETGVIRKHYSISMWIYINQHPTSYAAYSKETNVFRYGMVDAETGNPRLSYHNDLSDSNKEDKYWLYPTNANDKIRMALDIPAQSWNHVVINYNELSVDVFLNGDLVKSQSLKTAELPVYGDMDVVEVGEGDNTVTNGGLHGAICNVVYYKRVLTAFEIAGEYNLNRYNNPPVNRLE
jgi:hypothetical protein